MKRTTIVEVRPTRPEDGEFFALCTWIATDSRGIRFGSDSQASALEMARKYNGLRADAQPAVIAAEVQP